jgi:uncharacterized damage-inducible protein DinB
MTETATVTGERADLLQTLATHRYFLRHTTRDITDEQARQRTTVSALTLGGLIKHISQVEESWANFVVAGPDTFGTADVAAYARREDGFRMNDDETLAELLDAYERVARRTDALVTNLPDLDADQPLPEAPWFEPGARRSARRVFLHVIAETSQHAGHADIVREALDGAKTMG